MTAALGGGELATEWVTLLPETATLAKKLREFRPRPIKVEVEADYDQVEREGRRSGKRAGQSVHTEVDRETKGTGTAAAHNIADGLDDHVVTKAAREVGRNIRLEVEKESRKTSFKGITGNLITGFGGVGAATMQVVRNIGTIAMVTRYAARAARGLSLSLLAGATALKFVTGAGVARLGVALGFAAGQANRLATQVARVTSALLVLAAAGKFLNFMHRASKLLGLATIGLGALTGLALAGVHIITVFGAAVVSAMTAAGAAIGVAAGAAVGLLGPALAVTKIAFSGMSEAAKEFNKQFKETDEAFNKDIGQRMGPLLTAVHDLKLGITDAFTKAFQPAFTWLGGALQNLMPRFKGLATTLGNLGGEIAGTLNFKAASGQFDRLFAASDKFFQSFLGESGIAGVVGGLVDFATTAAESFSHVGDNINDTLLRFGEFLSGVTGDQMKQVFSTISAQLQNVWKMIGPLINVVRMLAAESASSLAPGFKAVGNAIKQATPGLINLSRIIMPALSQVLEKLAPAIPALVAAFTPWAEILAVIAPVAADLITKLVPFAPIILAVTAAFKAAVIVMALYNTAMLLFTNITKIARAVQWAFNAALAANPIGLVIAAIAAVVAGLTLFFTKTETGRKLWDKIWTGIKDTVEKVWNFIKVEGTKLWESLRPNLESLGRTAVEVFGQLKNAFQELWPKIQPVVEALAKAWFALQGFQWKIIIEAIKIVAKTIGWWVSNVIVPGFKLVIAAAKQAWENLKAIFNFIKGAWEVLWFAVQVGWKVGEMTFDAISSVVSAVWNNVLKPIFDAFAAVWDFLVEKLQWFGDVWKTVWDGLKTAVQAVWDFLQPVRDFIGDMFDRIGDMGKAAGDAIKAAWSGLTNILKSPLNALGRFLQGLPDNVFGIEIPFVADLKGWGASLAGLRSGGVIQGPGTGTSDSIVGVNSANVPIVRVSAGEGVVPADRLDSPLGKQLFNLLLALPTFRTGGVIGEFMSKADNAGYQMGGFSLNSFDCSGLVSAMVNVSMGRAWNEGPPGGSPRTATGGMAAWLKSQGFQKGSGGSNTLRVGFKNGGPGGGHTAGTLPDGTNFESTSGGVRFGSEAAGAAEFPEQWFLPRNGPEDPGAGGIPGSALSGAFSSSGIYGGGVGGASGAAGTAGGSTVVDPKKVREAQDKLTNVQNDLEVAKQRLDEYLAKEARGEKVNASTLENARNRVEELERDAGQAEEDLETAKQGTWKPGKTSDRSSEGGSDDWSSVGGMIFNGFLESMGFDGSVFKNLFETPNVKSVMAGLNFGMGLLTADWSGEGAGGAPQDLGLGGGGPSGLLDVGTEMLAGIGEQAGVSFPVAHGDQALAGGTPGPGNVFDLRGSQLGVSPAAFEDKMGEMTAASKRHPTLGPGQ